MRILVTGATGFLGYHLCRRLVSSGHTVTILRRETSDVTRLNRLDLRHEIGEITGAESVDRATRAQDVVIHAAASFSNRNDTKHTQYRVNVEGTRNVVEACIRNRVGRLLHVSSVAAVGIPEDSRPANEEFKFNLGHSDLHYYISKHKAEGVVASAVSKGLDAVVVNPSGIWGPAGSFYRGSSLVEEVRRKRILSYACGGVCIVHVEDVIDGILAAVDRGLTGHRYILGGENMTFLQMMKMVAAGIGVDRSFIGIPSVVMNSAARCARLSGAVMVSRLSNFYANYYCASRFCYYDSIKARVSLGFQPRPFDAILKECLAFQPVNAIQKGVLSAPLQRNLD
jgi:dihydroflavonol-4-reductase